MRIDANQTIAGFPALDIRRLMRGAVGGQISERQVRERLKCSKPVADDVLATLQRAGFVTPVDGRIEVSPKGNALAQATAAKPLLRTKAAQLISELVGRAKLVNADDGWAYIVERLVVFGSFVRGAVRPNDVDIACKPAPRWTGDAQAEAEERRRDLYPGQFRNTIHYLYWPKFEVLRFLKARSRGLSMHELDDWILKHKHEVIFEERRPE